MCISGEATEGDAEVSAFRDLPRVGTNGIRGGACLVIAEGLCLKSPKLRKVVDKLGVPGWEFLRQLGQHKVADEDHTPKYLTDAVGGRPILAYPNRPGGFRLVYGRARTAGLAGCAVNPGTMVILRNFVAIGTQVKLEYPGKATAMGVCDTVEGPIVELDDGSLVSVLDAERAKAVLPNVRRIVDLGEIVVPFGEFLENNRALVPGAYSIDWHLRELEAAGATASGSVRPSYEEAHATSVEFGVPLHPAHLLFWHDLTVEELRELSEFVEREGRWTTAGLELPWTPAPRELLVRLGFLHVPNGGGQLRGIPS